MAAIWTDPVFWRAVLPVIVAPLATALIAGFFGIFGASTRQRRQLLDDVVLIASRDVALRPRNDLRDSVNVRVHELKAWTDDPRIARGDLPAVALVVMGFAAAPIAFWTAQHGKAMAALGLSGLLGFLGLPVAAAWLFLSETLPARAATRIVYLRDSVGKVAGEYDAEVAAAWAWFIGATSIVFAAGWIGLVTSNVWALVAAPWGLPKAGEAVPPSTLTVWWILLACFVVGALLELVWPRPVKAYLDKALWGVAGEPQPGMLKRFR